jgi:hypothetical protein
VQDSLQPKLVSLKRSDGLVEHLLGTARSTALETGSINLFPIDGHTVGLEDGLDALGYLGTDTITGDEGDGVFAAKLGRLEDVGLDSSE